MGYYTSFELEYTLPEDGKEKTNIAENFKQQCHDLDIEIPRGIVIAADPVSLEDKMIQWMEENENNYNSWINLLRGDMDSVKWYEHKEEMTVLSKEFPDILFTLKGEGEESGDIWKCYYKGGKSHRCEAKITFDEFDESKLK